MAEDEPRCVHYQFAHVALRTLVFQLPSLATVLWDQDDPSELLDNLCVQVGRACRRQTGEGGNLRAEHMRVSKRELGRRRCVIIELPEPIATTEAYMVAIVHVPDEAERRYFTLEHSALRPAPHTVLGEWSEQGSHFNMGAGPEPTVDAFLVALGQLLLD
jgi:hypothetical protein